MLIIVGVLVFVVIATDLGTPVWIALTETKLGHPEVFVPAFIVMVIVWVIIGGLTCLGSWGRKAAVAIFICLTIGIFVWDYQTANYYNLGQYDCAAPSGVHCPPGMPRR